MSCPAPGAFSCLPPTAGGNEPRDGQWLGSVNLSLSPLQKGSRKLPQILMFFNVVLSGQSRAFFPSVSFSIQNGIASNRLSAICSHNVAFWLGSRSRMASSIARFDTHSQVSYCGTLAGSIYLLWLTLQENETWRFGDAKFDSPIIVEFYLARLT